MGQKSCQLDKNVLSYEFLKKKSHTVELEKLKSYCYCVAFSLKIHNSAIFYPIDMILCHCSLFFVLFNSRY